MRGLLFFLVLLFAGTTAQAAQLNFERGGFWLVNPAPTEIALRGDGADSARLSLYRLSDPTLLAQVLAARASRSLSEGELLRRVTTKLKPVWQADWTLDPANTQSVSVPLLAAASVDGTLPNGVYVLTAGQGEDSGAAQWFIRSGLSIDARFAGGQAFVTAFDTAGRSPRNGTQLHWTDATGATIGEVVNLPSSGAAVVPVPDGATLLLANGEKDDLDFAAVPARQTQTTIPGAVLYPTQDASDKIQLLVAAPGDAPDVKSGDTAIALQPLLPGLWRSDVPVGASAITASRDGQELVKAMLSTDAKTLPVVWLQKPTALLGDKAITVRFKLAGTLAHQSGTLLLQPTAHEHAASQAFQTDAKGAASVTINPAALQLTAPGTYTVAVQIQDARSASLPLPIWPAQNWLELTPQFADNVVPENVTAGFAARLRDAGGGIHPVAVTWELSREAYSFEWYQADDGRWVYRTKTALQPVDSGQAAAGKDKTAFDVPVAAGRYRLTARAGDKVAVQSFTAGWWLAAMPAKTPETIDLAAQVEAAPDGSERVAIFVDPPFPARVWLAALNSTGAAPVQVADIPDEGGFIYVPRSALAPGQPLTLMAFAVPRDPGAALVRAEAMASQPLGAAVTFVPDTLNAHATDLSIGKLPASARALLTIVGTVEGKPETLLWQSSPLDVDATGNLHVTVPALTTTGPLTARLFIAHDEDGKSRLDIVEHALARAAVGKISAKR